MTYLRTFWLIVVSFFTGNVASGQAWVSAGTAANEIAPTELMAGARGRVSDDLQLGVYGVFGQGDSGYSIGFNGEVWDDVSPEIADDLGHSLVGLVAQRKVRVFGGGLSIGVDTSDEDKVTHTLLLGYEAGDNGALYQVRQVEVIGSADLEYGIRLNPHRYEALRFQYMGFVDNLIFGLGYVYGTASGPVFHFGYSF